MSIEPTVIKRILASCGVDKLHHANTVVTSLSFLRNGGLLSRGYAEESGIPQTPQKSDETDKDFGVYYDIFFDSVDIHVKSLNVNHYGPVLFVYSLDVLDTSDIEVKVTKTNPIYWPPGMTEEEKYFTDEAELEAGYSGTGFGQHITICNMRRPLSFEHLQNILIEDPKIAVTDYFDQAKKALEDEVRLQGITAPLTVRKCAGTCNCHKTYNSKRPGYTYHRFKLEL